MGIEDEDKIVFIGNGFGIADFMILVARKWIGKIFDVRHVNSGLMMIKIFIGKRTVGIVMTYVSQ